MKMAPRLRLAGVLDWVEAMDDDRDLRVSALEFAAFIAAVAQWHPQALRAGRRDPTD